LHFTSEALQDELHLVGNVTVSLTVSSNATDTDFIVKLVDVFDDPNQTEMLIQVGAQRMRWREGFFAAKPAPAMEPTKQYTIEVVVGFVSYAMNKGHKLRLTVAGSHAPFYSINPNSGAPLPPFGTPPSQLHNVTARNTVCLAGTSFVALPVVPASSCLHSF
jgi:putative CocE/NonD family hydrolase